MGSAGRSMNEIEKKKKMKTYTIWQTNNGVYCTTTLKEVVTVWVVVVAHQLDILLRGSRVAFRHYLPTSGMGNIRNSADRAPLCVRIYDVSEGHENAMWLVQVD